MANRLAVLGVGFGMVGLLGAGALLAGELPESKAELARTARARALEQREGELLGRSMANVEAEVSVRAQEMGVEISSAALTALFSQIAWSQLDLDRCSLRLLTPERCRRAGQALETAEVDFLRQVGFSAAEFKAGRRAIRPAADLGDKGLFPPSGSQRTDPQYCVCDVSIANRDRWIDRYWGLECNGHAGHGVCSTDLDWAHSAGAGAMTGTITANLGYEIRTSSCPDDHRTCFKGPMSSKTGGGEWGNVCNCDIGHSQFSDPQGAWYGGDATDAELVAQVYFPAMMADGPCAQNGIGVQEFIKENDPFCCDDPLGTLLAQTPVTDGTTVAEVPASVQNCNGGSQSGQPPNCGTFGATIRITATCQTGSDETFGSCEGRCGQILPDATCNCDFDCQYYGDCCDDYCARCSTQGVPFPCSSGGDY